MNNGLDAESLVELDKILSGLDESALPRTLGWIVDKYGKHLMRPGQNNASLVSTSETTDLVRLQPSVAEQISDKFCGYSTLSDLLSEVNPKTDAERFLLSAYWFTKGDSDVTFTSSDVVVPLRNAGYEIKRTSNALVSLKRANPIACIVQLKKNKGRSGHLTLKMTESGVKKAKEMIRNGASDE